MRKANSWEYFDEVAKHHEKNKTKLISNISLEEMWCTLVRENTFNVNENESFLLLKKRIYEKHEFPTPLDVFQDYLNDGLYPPPEYLLWFSKIFSDYYQGVNNYDLEEFMFGRKTPAIGTEKQRHYAKQTYVSFNKYMRSKILNEQLDQIEKIHAHPLSAKPINKNLTQMASEFINEHNLDNDLDSFLRGYRRYKNKTD